MIYVNIDKANFCRKGVIMTKVVSCLSKTKNGVIATAKEDRFYVELIYDGVSIRQEIVYRRDFLSSAYKYPSPIHMELLKSVEAEGKDLYIDSLAKNLISAICEANRLIF